MLSVSFLQLPWCLIGHVVPCYYSDRKVELLQPAMVYVEFYVDDLLMGCATIPVCSLRFNQRSQGILRSGKVASLDTERFLLYITILS